jgi:uncharacterized protein
VQPSRFNIVAPVADSDRSFVVNLLSGQADVLDAEEVSALEHGTEPFAPELVAKGYVVDPEEEAARYRSAYLDFVDSREDDEVQLFYVPSYACNFGCSYCYQRSYEYEAQPRQDGVIRALFAYVDQQFAGRRKYLTLFGGEPLLPGEAARRAVEHVVAEAGERTLDLAVVTNGYHLESYLDLLSKARIREIQVTLDGTKQVHDRRRQLVTGEGSFDAVVSGIDAALARDLPVNLRSVLDRDNVGSFLDLARFAIDRGWTEHPRFKTQIGRNYELHDCQAAPDRLYSRLELYQELYRIAREHPELLRYHRPAFSVARFLFDEGRLPPPLFDACPGTKTEWAFDYTGRIYSCTATVGKLEEALGRFYREVELDAERVAAWRERDVLGIAACRSCALQLACGGGCGAVAKTRSGRLDAPDCRPVREVMSLGIGLYGAGDV